MEGDQRVHDEPFDRNNLQRESVGIAGKVGAAVNMFGSLTGEMAIGYVDRVYKDPTLPNVAGRDRRRRTALAAERTDLRQTQRDVANLRNDVQQPLPGNSAAISRSRSIMRSAIG